jgi:hypothetical protein
MKYIILAKPELIRESGIWLITRGTKKTQINTNKHK